LPSSRAVVSALDPAVQIGLGLFEVMRAYEGEPYLIHRHLERMRRSADYHGVDIRYSDATIARATRSLLRALELRSAYVRLIQTGGGTFLIRAIKLDPLPAAWYRSGAAVRYAPWRRDPRGPLFGHKTLNYLENVQTLFGARGLGLADMLFQGLDGRVLEGCVTNVFLVKGGRLRTPALGGILPGVTRATVLEIARSEGMRASDGRVLPRDLERADEVFLTNAMIEVLPVSRVGSHRIGPPGPVTRSLMAGYRSLVEWDICGNS
jgi:branched-subunit amino acid aminotransferase/4-amino-4-deoxychorismate lyase